ncbi:MAG: diguanylate cyclase [Spirochaetales bacterium]|nr:diguanylate cyclase [Spirochaetales bacterium]
MKDNKRWKYIANSFLALVVVVSLAMITYVTVKQWGMVTDYTPDNSVYMVDDGWVVLEDDGQITEFNDFQKQLSVNKIHLSRIFIFPQDYNQETLNFIVSFCAVQVYQDGNLIYSYGSEEQLEAGVFPGKYEVNIKLDVFPGEASEVEVVFTSTTPLTINPFFFGDSLDLMHNEMHAAIPSVIFVTGAFVLVFAMALIVILGRKKYSAEPAFYYFLFLVLTIACWMLTNIKALGHMGFNMGVMGIASYELFMLIPVIFCLFLYYSFSRLRVVDLIAFAVSVGTFLAVNVLHLSNKVKIYQTDLVSEIVLGVCLGLAVVQSIYEYARARSGRSLVLMIEILILVIGSVIQIILRDRNKSPYLSQALLLPLTLFIVLHMAIVISEFFSLMAEGRKAGDYLVMAKTDPLTGLGNRRALDQYITEISNTTSPFFRIGCIVCDLNDLKITNDIHGHAVGDQLIKDFAKCLEICFENRGVPFRTGGDEFYILFSDVEVDMSIMMRRLTIGIEGSNTSTDYKLSCSSGCYADYVPSHNEAAVWDIIKFADAEMYKQKKKDREQRSEQEGEPAVRK